MKTNKFATRVTVVALCAAASALATPAHAQWAFQKSVVSSLQDNSETDSGNANHGVDDAGSFLAVTAGGQSSDTASAQALGQYNMTETQIYVWNGGGSPTDSFDATETDTLDTTASAVPGTGMREYSARASAGTQNANYVASAGVSFLRGGKPSDSYGPAADPAQPVSTDGVSPAMFDTTLSASAGGDGTGGAAFAAQGKAQTSFQ